MSLTTKSATASALATVSGIILPIDRVQQRVPHPSRHLLENAIYEQTPDGNLANHHHVLRVRRVAPHFERVVLDRPIPTESDGHENLLTELIARTGPDATFVYASDARSIIAAWGPDFNLHPLDRREFPGVFINSRAAEVLPSFARDSLLVSERDEDDISLVDEVPQETLERESALTSIGSRLATRMEGKYEIEKRELELFVLHEKTFCKSFKSPNEAHAVLATHVAKLKPKFKGTGLVPEASRIVGPCTNDTKFMLPKEVSQCPMDSPKCSRTAILLNYYRKYYAYKARRRDLTVIFSNYTTQDETFHDIIGSAYVGATCNRDYGWAWVHHTNVNDIVFAHEVGHSLGALHEEQGIMKPAVGNQTENVEFSSKSIGLMNQFIGRASSAWCLKNLNWKNDASKISVPRSVITNKMLAHDLSFARFYGETKTNILIGITTKTSSGRFDVGILMLQNVASVPGGFSGGSWKGPYNVPGVTSYKHGAVGVSFHHIRSKTSNDVVISYLKQNDVMEYVVGFGISISDASGLYVEEWSEAMEIPFSGSSQPISSIGIDVGDMERDGKLDLAVGFVVGKDVTNFKIGAELGADGQVTNGWSQSIRVRPTLSATVKSVSVAILNIPGESGTHVAFYTNERLGKRLQRYYRVAKKVATSGAITDDWTTAIPAQVAPISAISGGFGVDTFSGSDELTTVVMQSAAYGAPGAKSFAYLDFGFNITAGILADKDGTIFESILYGREAGCSECYNGKEKETCLQRMKLCEERKHEYFGGKALTVTSVKNEANYTDTLFCAGFHKIFISPEGDTCGRNSAREFVSAEGMSVLFRERLEQLIDENGTFTEADKSFETIVGLEYDKQPIEGTAENGRKVKIFRPNKMRLQLKLGRKFRRDMIQEALRRLNTQHGIDATFKDVSTSKIVEKWGGTFLVHLTFTKRFEEQWVKNEIWRPYGTSGSTW